MMEHYAYKIIKEKRINIMAKQFNMDDFIKSCGEPHLACALLLDVSGSMEGNAINSLNNSIKQFKDNVSRDFGLYY